jgi:hypothetical protein
MSLENCKKIVELLNEKLILLKSESKPSIVMFEKAKGLCVLSLWELKDIINKIDFLDQDEEILFFKTIKPQVLSKLIFYDKLLSLESRRPKAFHMQEEYLKLKIKELNNYFEENNALYLYYWKSDSSIDEFFFLRANKKQTISYEIYIGCADPDFSTQHDFTFACIIAYENLIKYLENELDKLQYQGSVPAIYSRSTMKWTGNKIDLVEIAYGLHATGTINNGNIDIKEIIEAFSNLFNIELDDFYRTYQDIRARKTERIKFIDKLKQSLQNRMDEADA